MERKTNGSKPKKPRELKVESSVYEPTTPLFSKYYQKVRERIRFPRYYKKAVNW